MNLNIGLSFHGFPLIPLTGWEWLAPPKSTPLASKVPVCADNATIALISNCVIQRFYVQTFNSGIACTGRSRSSISPVNTTSY
ncbi:hypothetical protein, partial [Pseudomonas neuropathica]|uniref:hypothetical protein n=1 Tax=Pseudomonas neuropathica TaxID=2730425 RepID=UPI003F76A323